MNIVKYAYEDVGKCEITSKIETSSDEEMLTLTIKDQGKPFNPLNRPNPDITLAADERQIGGLGIYMVKKSMDEVTYQNSLGYNVLIMYKK